MKVLLVVPTHRYPETVPLSFSDFPSGFAYVSAALTQAGHTVLGLNPNNVLGYPSAPVMLQHLLTKKISETQPDLIGLGGLCTDYAFIRDAMKITRSVTSVPVVIGGQIITNDAEFIFQHLAPDYGVIGEGEEVVVGIANKEIEPGLLKAMPVDTERIPDYTPFGIDDMLDNHSKDTRLLYRYPRPNPRPFTIVASRGCPFSCTFCIHGHREAPYRARSIPNIMEEIKVNYEKYKFNILIILDELFAVNKARMKEFCDAVLAGKQKYGWDFNWMFQTHASAALDVETLTLAKQAGCFFFSYGLESASPIVLKSMNKRIDPQQVVDAIALAKQSKVGFGANLIFGDPAETEETWAESLAFWLKHGQDCFMFLSTIMPYPGSKIFDQCVERGLIPDRIKYYERIDKGAINMTTIPNHRFDSLLRLTHQLGGTDWIFPKLALDVTVTSPSTIHATCPHCGFKNTYIENIPDPTKAFMLGTGCVFCNGRMRVNTK